MIREREKTISIGEDTYRLRKFPALSGAYFLKFATEKLMPAVKVFVDILSFGKMKATEENGDKEPMDLESMINAVLPILTSISKEDLAQLMTDCLNHCDKILPAGPQPVMDGNAFGVPDLEYDVVTCLILCYHVIEFNVQGFFGEGGLRLSPEILKNLTRSKQ